ncbi:hypothetical protein MKZ38_009853 [Zalerion maritima]|uniref:Uncharacterized protein n=1 Tax=Zalerion maritima TaxID=339359 RepID=A0AAD5RGB0_9PEZI|nr:hypothetical protein MKZ38_009853 [Zalerion maritima]
MAIMTANGSGPRAPSRSVSFQKMLELEKKYKLERLQNVSHPAPSQRYPPSSSIQHQHLQQVSAPQQQPQPSPSSQQDPQPQPVKRKSRQPSSSPSEDRLPEPQLRQKDQRSSSFSQEQNLLMLKAVRRSVALPSLSISIPPPPNASKEEGCKSKPHPPSQPRSKSDSDTAVVKSSAGAQQKSVSFLAPPEDSDKSDDESICQSPTWAGYKEAEKKSKERKKQKKKEKEQSTKDARIAKNRLTARLSKAHPGSNPPSNESSPAPQNRKLLRSATEPLSIEYPQETPGDASHALAKLTGQPHQPSGKRPPERGTNSFVGGVKLATQSESTVRKLAEARERAIERDIAAAKNPTAVQPRAFSITAGTLPRLGRKTPTTPSPTASKEEEIGKQKEKGKEGSRPPISIHDLFKQGRSSSMPQAPNNKTNGNEEHSIPEPNPNHVVPHNRSTPALLQHASTPLAQSRDSRDRPGSAGGGSYVQSSREQSTERAISGFKDEIKVGGFFHRFRVSSQPPKEKQSKARDAIRSPPKNRTETREVTRSTSPRRAALPAQAAPRIDDSGIDEAAANWPPPPMVSSPTLSEKSSQASLRIPDKHSRTHLSPNNKGPGSPTFSFTSNMTSYFEHQPISRQLIEVPQQMSNEPSDPDTPKIPEVAKTPTLISEFNQATTLSGSANAVGVGSQSPSDSQGESRTSERSSASSYADSHEVSPPVSPATTPDTSRPQSQKGGVSAKDAANYSTQDEALPEAFYAVTFGTESKSQTSSNKSSKDSEDCWSRSAVPIDIEEQSVLTNMSNLDLNDTATSSKTSLPHPPAISSPSSRTSSTFEDAQETLSQGQDGPPMQRRSSPDRHGDISFLPPLKHQPLGPPSKGKLGSKLEARIFPVVMTPQNDRSRSMSPAPSTVSKTETPRPDESESSGPASYLQEARKSTQAPPPMNALKAIQRGQLKASNRHSTLAAQNELPDKPMAKMFVECCHCKFFHDMPSRVYECMATPDSFVEDRQLGVSGAITTMVKCPWCAHNMSKECCAGYMALVMLQQRLH